MGFLTKVSRSLSQEELALDDETIVSILHEILAAAQMLSQHDNFLVKVSAERIGVIAADALLELDPDNFDGPWDVLPSNGSRT